MNEHEITILWMNIILSLLSFLLGLHLPEPRSMSIATQSTQDTFLSFFSRTGYPSLESGYIADDDIPESIGIVNDKAFLRDIENLMPIRESRAKHLVFHSEQLYPR